MAEKTQFDSATVPLPAPEAQCCYNCVYGQRDLTVSLGTVTSHQQFVKCVWGPPSVVILPIGIDQVTGQARIAVQSKFPIMGYTEFCHRFEPNSIA